MPFLCKVFQPDAGLRCGAVPSCAAAGTDEATPPEFLRPGVALVFRIDEPEVIT